MRAAEAATTIRQAASTYPPLCHRRCYALVLSTVVAAPASTGSWTSSFHPSIEVDGRSTKVLVEQLQAIDPDRRLARKVGRISAAEQIAIDDALKLVLGLF